MRKRPYGISYDGKPPARYLVRYAHNFDISDQSGPYQNEKIYVSSTQNRGQQQEECQPDINRRRQNRDSAQSQKSLELSNSILRSQLDYISQFLTMTPNSLPTPNSPCPPKDKKKSPKFWRNRLLRSYPLISSSSSYPSPNNELFLHPEITGLPIKAEIVLKVFCQTVTARSTPDRVYHHHHDGDGVNDFRKLKAVVGNFIVGLSKFLQEVDQAYKIWVLDFASFGLLANVFSGWVGLQRHVFVDNSATRMQKLLRQVFLIFCQWCYQNKTIHTRISKKGNKFIVHIDL